jgi:dolichol-phosphate mannosyltransferase
MTGQAEHHHTVRVAVVVPVKNEEGNVELLIGEIEQALSNYSPIEIIYVDDGSTDGTLQILRTLMKQKPHLKVFKHVVSCGQSSAVRTGVRAASANLVATLDGDGQNNPAYLPELFKVLEQNVQHVGLVAGQRMGRRDTGFKKIQSKIANGVRSRVLKDVTRDTGCGLKAFRRDVYLALPYFDALHRFMPALVAREGYAVRHVDVVDRPRHSGTSNYGFFDRLWVGIMDLCGVWWLIRRRKRVPQVQDFNHSQHADGVGHAH